MASTPAGTAASTVREIRSAAKRWTQIEQLLGEIQRLIQIAAIVDLSTSHPAESQQRAIDCEDVATELRASVDREISLLTCELLASELKLKMKLKKRTT